MPSWSSMCHRGQVRIIASLATEPSRPLLEAHGWNTDTPLPFSCKVPWRRAAAVSTVYFGNNFYSLLFTVGVPALKQKRFSKMHCLKNIRASNTGVFKLLVQSALVQARSGGTGVIPLPPVAPPFSTSGASALSQHARHQPSVSNSEQAQFWCVHFFYQERVNSFKKN